MEFNSFERLVLSAVTGLAFCAPTVLAGRSGVGVLPEVAWDGANARQDAVPHALTPANDAAWAVQPVLRIDQPQLVHLRAQDAATDDILGLPHRVGVVQGAGLVDYFASARAAAGPNGETIWRLKVELPGAMRARVHFTQFALPLGASLQVWGADQSEPWSFTGAGPRELGTFWTSSCPGETVMMEYAAPVDAQGQPVIQFDAVAHIYRDSLPLEAAQHAADSAASCHTDSACDSRAASVRSAVARFEFVDGEDVFLCSGTLLNDAAPNSQIPWFATAAHCVSSQRVADTVEVFWLYQSDSCNGSVRKLSNAPRSEGADLAATISDLDGTDFTLLRLREGPPSGVTFMGWDLTPPTATSAGQSKGKYFWLHHPHGSFTRVTTGDVAGGNTPRCTDASAPNYVYMSMNTGTSEQGSSGGALCDPDGFYIGTLSALCGPSSSPCSNKDFTIIFGVFARSYAALNLGRFLNNPGTDDQFEPNNTLTKAATLDPAASPFALKLFDESDFFAVTFTRPVIATFTATFTDPDGRLTLQVFNGKKALIKGLSPAAQDTHTLRLRPGKYSMQIKRSGVLTGDYTLKIDTLPASDVNSDNVVDVQDVAAVLRAYAAKCKASDTCPDVDGDGKITVTDLGYVLSDFGLRRREFTKTNWYSRITEFYNTDLLPVLTGRTEKQQKSDVSRLKAVKP